LAVTETAGEKNVAADARMLISVAGIKP